MKNKLFFKKLNICATCIVLGISTVTGCGITLGEGLEDAQAQDEISGDEYVDEEEIELLDPIGAASEYEYADYRNIYNAEVIQCVISPEVTEYQYITDEPFWKYGALPGDTISSGDVLIYGTTESVEDSIERLTDTMRISEEDHNEEITTLYENRYDAYKEEYRTSCEYMNAKNNEPKEDAPWYDGWAAGVMPLESAYKNAKLNREQIDTKISESEDLYSLEVKYNSECLSKLEGKLNQARVIADVDGVLVAVNYYSAGDYILKNSEVSAIGNLDVKVLYSQYISAKEYSQMADLYAVVDGVRYEISYEPVDQNEYSRLKQKNTDVYVPFYIEDPDNQLKFGDTAALVMVREKAEDVLCVPSDSVVTENGQHLVYLYSESGSTSVPVTTGLVGKMYTEILEGLSAGDKVLTKSAVGTAGKTMTLQKGSSYLDFKGNAMLLYPSTEWIINPAKYGDAYVNEILVEKNENIVEGQELVRLEIVADSTAIAKLERKISRQNARLATLQVKKSRNYSNEVDYALEQAIRQKQTAIARYTEELNKLREYSGVITLTAPSDGVVLNLADIKVGDHINYKANLICLADTTESILAVENNGGKLGYGKEVKVSFKGEGGIFTEVSGTVVNVSDNALSQSLKSNTALIRFDEESAAIVASTGGSVQSNNGWGRALFIVETQTCEFDNAVIIPRSAVVMKNGDTFVKVKKGDRTELVQFIAGGFDMQNYWVVSGLSEGTEICLD